MSDFESLPSLPYLNFFASKQRVLHRLRNQMPFRVESPKREITHGSFGCTGTIPLCGPSRHCFNFYNDLLDLEEWRGNLERKCIPPPRFRLSTKPHWRVHNKVDNVRWKSPRYLPVSLQKYTIKAWAGRISVLWKTDFFWESQWLCFFLFVHCQLIFWSRLVSWLHARRVRWPRTISRILSLSAQTLFPEKSLHQEYVICVSLLKTSIMQISWSTYLLHANLSTELYGREALYLSTAFKASHEARQLSLHIVGLRFLVFNWQAFIQNMQWCGQDEFTAHRR